MKITVISNDDVFREIDLFDDALVIDVKQVLEIEVNSLDFQEILKNIKN